MASAEYVDFRSCLKYLDFVNMMSYDMGNPPKHHSALHPSPWSGWMTTQQATEAHLKAGIPRNKLVMGVPFYGRGDRKLMRFVRLPDLAKDEYFPQWDSVGKVPYLTDNEGKMLIGYENTRSLALKCQWAIDQQLRGAMYWEYADDDTQNSFARTLKRSILDERRGVEASRQVLVLSELGGGHQGFVEAATAWLKAVEEEFNAQFTFISDMKAYPADQLKKYHAIIMLNYPPFAWSTASMRDMERYIDEGQGSFIGFHHATLLGEFEGYPMWDWFYDFMGSIRFKDYIAPLASGTVCTEDASHPVMKGVGNTFVVPDDEWYTYDVNPRPNVHVLAHVDEASYEPASDVRMGDHPVIWTNPSKPSRNVYFQMGHHASFVDTPVFSQLMKNALHWALYD